MNVVVWRNIIFYTKYEYYFIVKLNGYLHIIFHVPSSQHQMYGGRSYQPSNENPEQKFMLKWLPGTTVARCYGCGWEIVNPPIAAPDDFVIVYKDHRGYRDRQTGQMQFTPERQNVHFHLRISCILSRYPMFDSSHFLVQESFITMLRPEHLVRLHAEFGWTMPDC